jgi:spore cortex protein
LRLFLKTSLLIFSIYVITGCAANDEAREINDGNAQVQSFGIDQNVYDDSQLRVANDAEEKIERLTNVRKATVIVTNRHAYVAVIMDSNGEVQKKFEKEISAQVKSTDKTIQNVYVSSNPEFAERMGDYGEEIQNGRPVRGLLEEFNEMVQRVFPTAR